MTFITNLECSRCAWTCPADTVMNLHPADDGPMLVRYDLAALRRKGLARNSFVGRPATMWRYEELLPLPAADAVSFGEGFTPVIRYDHPLARRERFELFVKDESQKNPTQTFKDRGICMAVSCARRAGLRKLAIPTAGNAGGSLAFYGRGAGLDIYVCMPEETPAANKHECLAVEGTQVEFVRGTIADAGKQVAEKVAGEGYFSVATLKEPGWRIEGKKTMGLELAEQFDWELPEVIVYPTGGGTGIVGMWKAFHELVELGLIRGRLPRMISVQTEVCAPLVRAFENGEEDAAPVQDPGPTIAAGLRVPAGVGHFMVLRAIRESGGAAIAVSEEAILGAVREMLSSLGVFPAPEGAATLAALPELVSRRLVRPGDRVVLFNTGSGRKYLNELLAGEAQ